MGTKCVDKRDGEMLFDQGLCDETMVQKSEWQTGRTISCKIRKVIQENGLNE